MIDVIIPAYLPTKQNHVFLHRAIKSLEQQTFKDFGIIIVLNGCYTDYDSVIGSIESSLNITWKTIDGKASGAIARNLGIQSSKKDFVAQLDADDQYHPQKLEKQVKFFKENPKYSFVGTLVWDYFAKNDIKESMFKPGEYQTHTQIARALYRQNIMCHGSIMFKRKAFISLNGYNETYKPGNIWPEYNKPMWEDWDLWKRAIQSGFRFYNIPERLYYWSVDTGVER